MSLDGTQPTPLIGFPRLAAAIGVPTLLLKLESVHPFSHTFKDRGALAVVREAKNRKAAAILAASCGNMGTAVAGAGAKSGIPALILLSREAPIVTKKMIAAFATRVWLCDGRFDELDAVVKRLTLLHPKVACVNTTLNEAFRNGFRSLMAELLDQLEPNGRYAVCVPTADGTLLAACYDEYLSYRQRMGARDGSKVRFVLAQPSGCAPLVRAHSTRTSLESWADGETMVLPLSVCQPTPHGLAALQCLIETEGTAIAVPERDIPGHAYSLAHHGGIFSDLVGGVMLGAINEIARQGWLRAGETPVGIYTGNGLIDSSGFNEFEFPMEVGCREAEEQICRELLKSN